MTCNYSPTQQNRLCWPRSTTITGVWAVSFLPGPDRSEAAWCLSHCLTVSDPLWCSACWVFPIKGVELPSNICRVPQWAIAYRSVAAQTLRTRFCCEEWSNFPSPFLSPLFILNEVKNESFCIWQIKSCIWLLWGKSCWNVSLGNKFTARCQGLGFRTGTHIQNTAHAPTSYTLEKAARNGQIRDKIIGK